MAGGRGRRRRKRVGRTGGVEGGGLSLGRDVELFGGIEGDCKFIP